MVWTEGQQLPTGPALGVARAGGKRQVVIRMDTDQFDEARAYALRENISMAHAIRLLVEFGLEAVADADPS